MTPSQTLTTCDECHAQFEGPDGFLCDACETALEVKAAADSAARAARKFLERFPAEYRDADPERVPSAYRATGTPQRVSFVGKSGSGKSCAMACHLKQRGASFIWVSATELREITTKAATEGGDWSKQLDKLKRTPVLAIDDISQARFSEAFATALFDILEHRNAHRLAIVWTSQKPMAILRGKIADQCGDADQAEAISRRLAQGATKLEITSAPDCCASKSNTQPQPPPPNE